MNDLTIIYHRRETTDDEYWFHD